MADQKSQARVKQYRQNKRRQGFTETNMWLSDAVRIAIDQQVAAGHFPSKTVAITQALEKEFLAKSTN